MEPEQAETLTATGTIMIFFGIALFLMPANNLEKMSHYAMRTDGSALLNVCRLIFLAGFYGLWQFARIIAGHHGGWVHKVASAMFPFTLAFLIIGISALTIEWKRKERLWKSK